MDTSALPCATRDPRLRADLGRDRDLPARRRPLPRRDRLADVRDLERPDRDVDRRHRDDAAAARPPPLQRRPERPAPAPPAHGLCGRPPRGRDRDAWRAGARRRPDPRGHRRPRRRLRGRHLALPARVRLAPAPGRPAGAACPGQRPDAARWSAGHPLDRPRARRGCRGGLRRGDGVPSGCCHLRRLTGPAAHGLRPARARTDGEEPPRRRQGRTRLRPPALPDQEPLRRPRLRPRLRPFRRRRGRRAGRAPHQPLRPAVEEDELDVRPLDRPGLLRPPLCDRREHLAARGRLLPRHRGDDRRRRDLDDLAPGSHPPRAAREGGGPRHRRLLLARAALDGAHRPDRRSRGSEADDARRRDDRRLLHRRPLPHPTLAAALRRPAGARRGPDVERDARYVTAPLVRISPRALRNHHRRIFDDLATYGELVWVDTGHQRFLVVNSAEHVRELMVERAEKLVKPSSQAIETGPPAPALADDGIPVAEFRAALAKGMGTGRIPDVVESATSAAQAEVAQWRDGMRFRLMPRMRRLAITATCWSSFGSRLSPDEVFRAERLVRGTDRRIPVSTRGAERWGRLTFRRWRRRGSIAHLALLSRILAANADRSRPTQLTATLDDLPQLAPSWTEHDRRAMLAELFLGAVGPLSPTGALTMVLFSGDAV